MLARGGASSANWQFRGGASRPLNAYALAYLLFSIIQVITNVLSMLTSAGSVHSGGLAGQWDVGGSALLLGGVPPPPCQR